MASILEFYDYYDSNVKDAIISSQGAIERYLYYKKGANCLYEPQYPSFEMTNTVCSFTNQMTSFTRDLIEIGFSNSFSYVNHLIGKLSCPRIQEEIRSLVNRRELQSLGEFMTIAVERRFLGVEDFCSGLMSELNQELERYKAFSVNTSCGFGFDDLRTLYSLREPNFEKMLEKFQAKEMFEINGGLSLIDFLQVISPFAADGLILSCSSPVISSSSKFYNPDIKKTTPYVCLNSDYRADLPTPKHLSALLSNSIFSSGSMVIIQSLAKKMQTQITLSWRKVNDLLVETSTLLASPVFPFDPKFSKEMLTELSSNLKVYFSPSPDFYHYWMLLDFQMKLWNWQALTELLDPITMLPVIPPHASVASVLVPACIYQSLLFCDCVLSYRSPPSYQCVPSNDSFSVFTFRSRNDILKYGKYLQMFLDRYNEIWQVSSMHIPFTNDFVERLPQLIADPKWIRKKNEMVEFLSQINEKYFLGQKLAKNGGRFAGLLLITGLLDDCFSGSYFIDDHDLTEVYQVQIAPLWEQITVKLKASANGESDHISFEDFRFFLNELLKINTQFLVEKVFNLLKGPYVSLLLTRVVRTSFKLFWIALSSIVRLSSPFHSFTYSIKRLTLSMRTLAEVILSCEESDYSKSPKQRDNEDEGELSDSTAHRKPFGTPPPPPATPLSVFMKKCVTSFDFSIKTLHLCLEEISKSDINSSCASKTLSLSPEQFRTFLNTSTFLWNFSASSIAGVYNRIPFDSGLELRSNALEASINWSLDYFNGRATNRLTAVSDHLLHIAFFTGDSKYSEQLFDETKSSLLDCVLILNEQKRILEASKSETNTREQTLETIEKQITCASAVRKNLAKLTFTLIENAISSVSELEAHIHSVFNLENCDLCLTHTVDAITEFLRARLNRVLASLFLKQQRIDQHNKRRNGAQVLHDNHFERLTYLDDLSHLTEDCHRDVSSPFGCRVSPGCLFDSNTLSPSLSMGGNLMQKLLALAVHLSPHSSTFCSDFRLILNSKKALVSDLLVKLRSIDVGGPLDVDEFLDGFWVKVVDFFQEIEKFIYDSEVENTIPLLMAESFFNTTSFVFSNVELMNEGNVISDDFFFGLYNISLYQNEVASLNAESDLKTLFAIAEENRKSLNQPLERFSNIIAEPSLFYEYPKNTILIYSLISELNKTYAIRNDLVSITSTIDQKWELRNLVLLKQHNLRMFRFFYVFCFRVDIEVKIDEITSSLINPVNNSFLDFRKNKVHQALTFYSQKIRLQPQQTYTQEVDSVYFSINATITEFEAFCRTIPYTMFPDVVDAVSIASDKKNILNEFNKRVKSYIVLFSSVEFMRQFEVESHSEEHKEQIFGLFYKDFRRFSTSVRFSLLMEKAKASVPHLKEWEVEEFQLFFVTFASVFRQLLDQYFPFKIDVEKSKAPNVDDDEIMEKLNEKGNTLRERLNTLMNMFVDVKQQEAATWKKKTIEMNNTVVEYIAESVPFNMFSCVALDMFHYFRSVSVKRELKIIEQGVEYDSYCSSKRTFSGVEISDEDLDLSKVLEWKPMSLIDEEKDHKPEHPKEPILPTSSLFVIAVTLVTLILMATLAVKTSSWCSSSRFLMRFLQESSVRLKKSQQERDRKFAALMPLHNQE